MDWLEEWFPFLRDLDQGSGALEIAFVVLVVSVLGVIGLTGLRRRRPSAVESRPPDDGPDVPYGRDIDDGPTGRTPR